MTAPGNRPILLALAVEGIVPVLGGCAGAIAAGPEGGVVGVAAGGSASRGERF